MTERKKKALELSQAEQQALHISVDKLLTLEEGRRFFAWLHNVCGWQQADVPLDALGRVEEGTLLYNATRRSIYAKARNLASPKLLAPVEEDADAKARAAFIEEGADQGEKT